jgi:hypothetical protein
MIAEKLKRQIMINKNKQLKKRNQEKRTKKKLNKK